MSDKSTFVALLKQAWKKTPLQEDVKLPPDYEEQDLYFEGQLTNILAEGVADALYGSNLATVVGKLNELIDEYNQLRADIVAAGTIPTTAQSVTKLTTG